MKGKLKYKSLEDLQVCNFWEGLLSLLTLYVSSFIECLWEDERRIKEYRNKHIFNDFNKKNDFNEKKLKLSEDNFNEKKNYQKNKNLVKMAK